MEREGYSLKSFKYSSHYWVLNFLSAERGPLKILDVGTSNGDLGIRLREEGHWVVGVENDGEWAEKARPHYVLPRRESSQWEPLYEEVGY